MDKYIDQINRILNPHARDIEPAVGDVGYAVGRVDTKGIDAERRRVTATLSTPRIDRYGEVVVPSAFAKTLDQFMTNPKFLGGHIYGSHDGSPTSIGSWIDIRITDEAVTGTAQFLDEGDELADKWWRRFKQGAAKTFSVGFIARAYEMRSVDVGGETRRVRHFTEADLLEVSAVEIPANPDALVRHFGAQPGAGARGASGDETRSAIVDAMLKDGRLLAAVREEIHKTLTDPLGPMDSFVREVVAAVAPESLRGRAHDHDDLDPDAPSGRNGDAELVRELTDLLR